MQITVGEAVHYRCPIGHAFTAQTLDAALSDDLCRAMTAALHALEEKAALLRRLARKADSQNQRSLAREWRAKAFTCQRQADIVRRRLAVIGPVS